jgi:S-adenosylmethionine-dependent methyltransferase
MSTDRNFDDLSRRFKKNIYNTAKGKLRLAILQQDLLPYVENINGKHPLRILDAGCGQGQLSLWLAEQGHELLLCDHSDEMLSQARENFALHQAEANVTFLKQSIQQLDINKLGEFDLVLNHAVLEWVSQPTDVLQATVSLLKPGGKLSLLYYNRNSLVFRNLIRGNFYKVKSEDYKGDVGGLTPTNPLDPEEVEKDIKQLGLNIEVQSGVRVFYDYMSRDLQQSRSYEDILEMEQKFCRQAAFRYTGRYMHIVAGKNE